MRIGQSKHDCHAVALDLGKTGVTKFMRQHIHIEPHG